MQLVGLDEGQIIPEKAGCCKPGLTVSSAANALLLFLSGLLDPIFGMKAATERSVSLRRF